MKILFISPRFEGGIGGHAKRVAEKLREQGNDVTLMDVPHIPIKKLKNLSFLLFGTLKASISKEKFDVAHAWNIPSAFVMKQINAKKKILSVHGVYSDQIAMLYSSTTGTLASTAESKALKLADVLTTDSKQVQKAYKEKLNVDFLHLAAPLDTTKFSKIPISEKITNQIAYIGRDSFEKGTDILKKLESKINGNVVYCTDVDWETAMKTLQKSSLIVIPSRVESIPQVVKEAFYLKTPVIAFDVGGIPEIITNNENGILIEPENSEKLLNAINSLLENTKEASRLTNNAYDYIIKNYSWDILLPEYMKLYEN